MGPFDDLLYKSGSDRIVENIPGYSVQFFAGPEDMIVETLLPEIAKASTTGPRRASAFEVMEHSDEVGIV